jgi:hypothetical protein
MPEGRRRRRVGRGRRTRFKKKMMLSNITLAY